MTVPLDCNSPIPDPNSGPQHFFSLIVADKMFSNTAGQFGQLDTSDPTAHILPAATWIVNMTCQASLVTP